jgi:hypothetical protein
VLTIEVVAKMVVHFQIVCKECISEQVFCGNMKGKTSWQLALLEKMLVHQT